MILDFFPENALGDGPKNSRIRVNDRNRKKTGKLTFELRFEPKAKYKNVSLIFLLENFLNKNLPMTHSKTNHSQMTHLFQVPKFTTNFSTLCTWPKRDKDDFLDRPVKVEFPKRITPVILPVTFVVTAPNVPVVKLFYNWNQINHTESRLQFH